MNKQENNHEVWYTSNRPIYLALSEKVKQIVSEVLEAKGIQIADIDSRAKTVESFSEKVKKGIDYDFREMQDLAGIRVIGYINSDVSEISKIIRQTFNVDEKLSKDKSTPRRIDSVGYKSEHIVARFTNERCTLPEFSSFKNMKFEIQIRTILQHAWAEIEHDRSYKFSGVLPLALRRRFYLVAGLLETADNEFDSISKEIDKYSKEVAEKTKQGDLNIQIDSTSLIQFLNEKYGDVPGIQKTLSMDKVDFSRYFVSKLFGLGIETLSSFESIIPSNFKSEYMNLAKYYESSHDYIDLMLKLLLVIDPEKYFEKDKSKSITMSNETIEFAKNFDIDLPAILKKLNISISDKESSP